MYNRLSSITEKDVVSLWQEIAGRTELVSEGGELIKVVYPGRLNDKRGADFRDAVLISGGRLVKGDIEVHVRAGDWQGHNHYQDVAYNGVVLHVALWRDSEVMCRLRSGREVPLVILEKYVSPSLAESPPFQRLGLPCSGAVARLSVPLVAGMLDTAGEKRFLDKTRKMEAEMAQVAAGQCLYGGIMSALGYSRNREQFRELACRVPLRFLESGNQSDRTSEDSLSLWQALLLGTAGLLPLQRVGHSRDTGDAWVSKLESLWVSYGGKETMSCHDWDLFKVRPQNHPVRRIAAMSYLLLRYRPSGILRGLLSVARGVSAGGRLGELTEALLVSAGGYWVDHCDFGLSLQSRFPALLGKGRADDIVVNVLLPFTYVWGGCSHRRESAGKVYEAYQRYPRLPSHSIERHMMRQLRLDYGVVSSACRQQGLIHIYKTLCTQGKCEQCPLNN